SMEEALDFTYQFYTKKVKPTPVYRGTLDLGDVVKYPESSLSIPIHMFARTMKATIPTVKKYSILSENIPVDEREGEGPTGNVNMSRTFKLKGLTEGEEDREVPEEEVERAYKYGKTIVPILRIDLAEFKL